MKDGDFGKPIIAIANCFTQFVPGHVHLKDLGQLVAREVEAAGGVAKEFDTIAVDDGIAMGHDGMLYSLPSRELIADSVEYMANAHCADALVCISNCDKITPGMLMAAMRLNIPAVFVSGGPMEAGKVKLSTGTRSIDLIDAMVAAADDKVSDADVAVIERSACLTGAFRGPVEPGAHFYRSLQLDAHGNPINKRNAWSTRATMYAHLIPPGAADTVHYRLKIPEDCGDQITLTAKLNYRKFSWWNTQWAFAGVRDPADPHPDVAKDHDDGRWVFQGSLAGVSANPPHDSRRAHRGHEPKHRHHSGGGQNRAAVCAEIWRSIPRTASAGTTTASACCCRGI